MATLIFPGSWPFDRVTRESFATLTEREKGNVERQMLRALAEIADDKREAEAQSVDEPEPDTRLRLATTPKIDAPFAEPEPELRKLRTTVQSIDNLSQDGFSEIAAIAKLALASLETPDGYRHLDNLAYALRAISGKADDIQNCINCDAEEVDCNYVDEAQERRWAAQRAYREQETARQGARQ